MKYQIKNITALLFTRRLELQCRTEKLMPIIILKFMQQHIVKLQCKTNSSLSAVFLAGFAQHRIIPQVRLSPDSV